VRQALDEARELEAQGRVREAIAAYQAAVSFDPDNVGALLGLGSLLRQSGEAAAARAKLERAAQLAGHDYRVWCELGLARADAGDLAGAREALAQCLVLNRDFAQGHLFLAQIDLTAGAVSEAIDSARRAVAKSPRLIDAHLLLGMAYVAAGRLHDAEAAFRKGLELAPGHPGLLLNLGTAARERGAPDEAELWLRRAVSADRTSLPAAQALAQVLIDSARHGDALRVLEEVRLPQGEVPAGLLLLVGEALEGLGRSREAEGAYRAAVQRQPTLEEGWCNLFELLRRGGEHAGAREIAQGALRTLPRSAEIRALHAAAFFDSGDADGGVAALEDALREGIHSARLYTLLGGALRIRNRPGEALAALDRALALAPRDGAALAEAALARHAIGETDAGLTLARQAIEAAPDGPAGFLALGAILLDRRAWLEARDVLTRARNLAPTIADAAAGLARALLGLGDVEAAGDRCREALALDPRHPEANRVYTELAMLRPRP